MIKWSLLQQIWKEQEVARKDTLQEKWTVWAEGDMCNVVRDWSETHLCM